MKKDDNKDTNDKQAQTIEEYEKHTRELTENWKRALADYQNLEKRMQTERREWARLASRDTVLNILPAVDILVQASLHTSDQAVQLALKELFKAFEREGLKKIETIGKQFDPHLMECIDVTDGDEENKVSRELRAGYKLHDTVIRPAQVTVVRKKADDQ